MSTHRQLAAILLALTLSGLGGCARANAGAAPDVVAAVTNDLIPPGDVTVYAVSNEGMRQVLGSVAPGAHGAAIPTHRGAPNHAERRDPLSALHAVPRGHPRDSVAAAEKQGVQQRDHSVSASPHASS